MLALAANNAPAGTPATGRDPRTQVVAAARDWSDVAAMLGDRAEALAWLDVIESLMGQLPASLIARRRELAGS